MYLHTQYLLKIKGLIHEIYAVLFSKIAYITYAYPCKLDR